MIKVLHSVSNMDRAGIETFIMNYYRYMDRNQVQFNFWCNKPNDGAYKEEIERLGGHLYHSPGYNPLKFIAYIRTMKKIVKDEKISIIHVHNGALGLFALLSARFCKVPVRIYHAHNCKIPLGKGHIFKTFLKPFIKYNANHLFACSHKSASFYYGKRIFRQKKYTFIANAIETERFVFDENKRNEMRTQYHLENKKVLLHVGRFSTQKNHVRLLHIFKALKALQEDAVLLLLGDGEGQEDMKVLAQSLGIEKDIFFMGNRQNINDFYQMADLFILPSLWEGFPVVAVEAQACALPCVFSTEVTNEVQITEPVAFVSLEEKDDVWAQAAYQLLQKNTPRIDQTNLIKHAGYDVQTEAQKLLSKYVSWAHEKSKKEECSV